MIYVFYFSAQITYFFTFLYRGFGFITFSDPASVDKVLTQGTHELDGKKVNHYFVQIFTLHFFSNYIFTLYIYAYIYL